MLGYSSGIRRDELMKIKPLAIDSSRMQVHVVQGKGKKDRYTILSEKALLVLRQYYKDQRPSVYLFEPITRKGRTLSESTLNKTLSCSIYGPIVPEQGFLSEPAKGLRNAV